MLFRSGAPLSQGPQQDARDALASLLEIRSGMEALNRQLEAEGEPAMRMRLGVHSGMVLAGSMGSSERLEYAIMGDTVNCASRIEGLEKERHEGICRILVSGETFALLYPEGPGHDGLSWRCWGPHQVKGRQEPLEIWELREGAAPVHSRERS